MGIHNNMRKQINRLVGTNLLAVIFFYLLYHTDNPHPYSNMLYFVAMGAVALWMFKQEPSLTPLVWLRGKRVLGDTVLGSLLMVGFYVLTIAGYYLARAGIIPMGGQGHRWVFFTAPWKEINLIVSVLGVVLVVVTLELFYRSYALELLRSWCSDRKALILCSLLSALRGWCGGSLVAGGYDFALSWVWGWIYLRAGLWAAIIVHLVWDIVFVYLSPG